VEWTGSLRALLSGAIDYAGLFPPAGLPMPEAVVNYSRYRHDRHAWALGCFVLPAARLGEFAANFVPQPGTEPCLLSALIGPDLPGDIARVDKFNELHRGSAIVDILEFKAGTPEAIREALGLAAGRFVTFHEIPLQEDLKPFLDILASGRGAKAPGLARAKIRTGGITPDAFPVPAALARFLTQCAAARVPFKATAGLHHPLRCTHSLTYEAGALTGVMHGFINVFIAAAFARAGWEAEALTEILTEQSPSAFRFEPDHAWFRTHALAATDLESSRAEFLNSFGSCSFEEPISDLQQLGWLSK
jgi:hypothetical protein